MNLTPWRFFLVGLAAWMNREQQAAIAYLREENRVLREKLGRRRILLSPDQKRRLAILAQRRQMQRGHRFLGSTTHFE